jgi:hypothetical protein
MNIRNFSIGIALNLSIVRFVLGSDLVCPTTVTVKPSVQSIGPEWKSIESSSTLSLERVAFFLKDPSGAGALVPNSTKKLKGEEREVWTFVRATGDVFWLSCVYHDTTAMLARRLDPTISQCEVLYDLLPTGRRLRVKAITCK